MRTLARCSTTTRRTTTGVSRGWRALSTARARTRSLSRATTRSTAFEASNASRVGVFVARARGETARVASASAGSGGARLGAAAATAGEKRALERLFPDVPEPIVDGAADAVKAVKKTLGPAYGEYVPVEVRRTIEAQARAERASGYALYAGPEGGAEVELGIYVALAFYLIARPGVVPWAFDQTVSRAIGAIAETSFDARAIRRGRRLGSGSFGTVYRCEDERTGRELVVKVPNAVEGASQLQNAEAYLNRRVARAPWVASGCAKFLGTYYEVEGARSPCLVWAYEEGEATLEDFLEDRRFPESLEDALRVRARANESEAKRVNRVAKRVVKDLARTVVGLHDIGIVHRDLKPANLVLMGKRFKLVDFGAACDLRSGENFDPEQALLDPKYSPPEQYIMSQKTPPPPPVISGVLAPLLWTVAQPQLFDSYSIGLILLQICVPQLRGKNVMQPNGAFQLRLRDAGYDLRAWRADVEDALAWDFSALDVNGGIAWDLACRLVTERNLILRGRLDVGAALAHPFLL